MVWSGNALQCVRRMVCGIADSNALAVYIGRITKPRFYEAGFTYMGAKGFGGLFFVGAGVLGCP